MNTEMPNYTLEHPIIKRLLDEYGLINADGETNVIFFGFDESINKWAIRYKNGLPEDTFEIFDNLINYLKLEQ